MNRRPTSSFRQRARQRGIVLIVALIVMVATILAAIALVSSVDVATLISGNLAFRQAGVQAADSGVEVARKWLMSQSDDYLFDNHSPSYFATRNGGVTTSLKVFDPATFDWSGKSSPLPEDAAGNTVAYVVHRMCDNTGDPALLATNCFNASALATGGCSNSIRGGGESIPPCAGNALSPFYRITVRVSGPRRTLTYVQAVIY